MAGSFYFAGSVINVGNDIEVNQAVAYRGYNRIGVAVGFVKTPAGMWVALGFVVLLIILNLTISLLQSKKRKHVVQTVMGEQIMRY